jgi:uncharacterized protein YjiS (DUF1127 family)
MRFLHGSIETLSIVHSQHFPIFRSQRGTEPPRRTGKSGRSTGATLIEDDMAYVSSNRTATASLGARFAEMGREALGAFAAWRLYRRTLSELQELSGRELADLGLNRSMLRRAAQEAVYGRAD